MASEQCTARVDAMRDDYLDQLEAIHPEDLIFIDETGTNQAMTSLYAKSPKGQRIYESRPVKRGRLYTVIGAIVLGGMLTTMTVEGGTTTEVFHAFVEHLLCPHLRDGHVVVLDRLPAHRNLQIRAMIEKTGATVLFLPPYSPELNPIELAWSKIKNIIRKMKPRSMTDIDRAVAVALPKVSREDSIGWFEHCGINTRDSDRMHHNL